MKILLIITREIFYRKGVFLSGVLSLAAATAGLIAGMVLLRGHDIITEDILVRKEKELREEMTLMEDYYRRIMRDMGYNVLIINREQSMPELEASGYPNTYLDYRDVWELAYADITTINHLLPVLQEKIFWEEQQMEIMLSGIRGQVPVFSKPEFLTAEDEYRSPITERVPAGMADIGFTVATSLGIRPGSSITLRGKRFEVNRIYDRRGTKDDITVWIPLESAQLILGRQGKISGIFALECVCDFEALGEVSREVTAVLPHAKVFEFTSLILTRGRVRQRAAEIHERVVGSVMSQRAGIRDEKERLASVAVAILVSGAGLWIFLLGFHNVRERRPEIGVMRAFGFSRGRILRIFLFKALIMGLAGCIAGCILGILLGIRWSGASVSAHAFFSLVRPQTIAAGLLLAPVLSLISGFLPAVSAASQDPAVILREE